MSVGFFAILPYFPAIFQLMGLAGVCHVFVSYFVQQGESGGVIIVSGRPKEFLDQNTKTENNTSEKPSFGQITIN